MITAIPPGLSFAETLVNLIQQKPAVIKNGAIILPRNQACRAVQALRQEKWPLRAWNGESGLDLPAEQPIFIAIYPTLNPGLLIPLLERKDTDLILLGCDPLSLNEPLPPTHPQYAYQQLLGALHISPENLQSVPQTAVTAFIRTVMQPGTRIPDWMAEASHPIIPLVCTDRVYEAKTLSLLVRETLAAQSSITLVIPDDVTRALVEATLNADGVVPNSPQGQLAKSMVEGSFCHAIADVLAQPDLLAWMKLLKHPLCTFEGLSTAHHPALLAWEAALRQNRSPQPSPWLQALLRHKDTPLSPSAVHPFEHRFKAHIALWHTFTCQPLPSWLVESHHDLPPCDGPTYLSLFKALFANTRVMQAQEPQQAVTILSRLDGWFTTDETVVLADFVDGVWPYPTDEAGIGHQAFEVALALSSKTLYLSFPRQRQGQQTVSSRWFLRLQACWQANGITPPASLSPHHRQEFTPQMRPQACPPLTARPRQVAVSGVQRLMNDPYVYYACDILSLRPWRLLGTGLASTAWGITVHQLIADATTHKLLPPYESSLEKVLELGDQGLRHMSLDPYTHLFWTQRWKQIAPWLLESLQNPSLREVFAETSGRLPLDGFTLTAIADRLEVSTTGDITVIDFKTGMLPTVKDMTAGWAPQLPLEGLIVQKGQFPGLPTSSCVRLRYIQLKGHGEIGSSVDFPNAQEAIDKADQGLTQLFHHFLDDAVPYTAADADTFRDYAPLVRRQEWVC